MNLSFEYYNSELWGSVGVGQYETKTHRDAPGAGVKRNLDT